MDRGIRLRQLTYFVEAARSGSLLKASEVLRVSQPAITAGLHDLERILGAKLLERNRVGVALTEYGKVFIHHAVNVLSEINSGVSRLEAVLKAESGHVAVGVPPIISYRLVPLAIARFKANHPSVVVTVNPAHADVLLPALKLNELDFMVSGVSSAEQMAGLAYDVLFHERLCLVARRGHPLAGRRAATLEELHGYPWFVPYPYRDFRAQVHALFRDASLAFPRNFIEGGHNIAAEYLRQSDAVAILPNNLAADSIEAGTLIELRSAFDLPSYPIGILRRGGVELTTIANLLIQEIRVSAARFRTPAQAELEPRPRASRPARRRYAQ